MGSSNRCVCGYGLLHLITLFLFLLILSSTQFIFIAGGRTIFKPTVHSQTEKEKRVMLKAQIGSRPPRCERRCNSCGHCEAIQVPTNPQINTGNKNSSSMPTIEYSRGDGSSNYKPMSWKCKCGNSIFNP